MGTTLEFYDEDDGIGRQVTKDHPLPVVGLSVTIANIGTVDSITEPVPILHPASSAVTQVNDSASNVTLIASRNARKGFYIWNNSTEILYVKFGATATVDDWSVRLDPDAFYEAPTLCYTGIVDGIWANNTLTGVAQITEVY